MSAAAPPNLPAPLLNPTFDSTLGVLLIGEILTAVLFGITSVQIYVYFGRCQRDGSLMRWTMSFLWIIDAAHLAFTSHTMYHYVVTNFLNPIELLYCPWSFAADMIFGDLSEVIITGIFAFRVWKLSGRVWPLIFILPPTFAAFAGAVGIGVLARKFPLYTDFRARFSWLWYATFTAQAFCDCAIAVALCIILVKQRTGFKRTDSLIRTLILYSINTCALTSSVAIASVITFAVMPHNFVFIVLAMILPKLMLNSLLALLNSRDSMRERISGPISIHLSKLSADSETPSEEARRGAKDQSVEMSVERYK